MCESRFFGHHIDSKIVSNTGRAASAGLAGACSREHPSRGGGEAEQFEPPTYLGILPRYDVAMRSHGRVYRAAQAPTHTSAGQL